MDVMGSDLNLRAGRVRDLIMGSVMVFQRKK